MQPRLLLASLDEISCPEVEYVTCCLNTDAFEWFGSSAEDKLMCPSLHKKVQERVTYLMDHAEKDRRFEDVLRLLEGVQDAVNNSATVAQLHSELCKRAELIVESIQQHLLEEEEV